MASCSSAQTAGPDTTTVAQYMHRATHDGRAVLVYKHAPGEHGEALPWLWLCRVGETLVACEDAPEGDVVSDEEFMVAVQPGNFITSIVKAWEASQMMRRKTRRLRRNALLKSAKETAKRSRKPRKATEVPGGETGTV